MKKSILLGVLVFALFCFSSQAALAYYPSVWTTGVEHNGSWEITSDVVASSPNCSARYCAWYETDQLDCSLVDGVRANFQTNYVVDWYDWDYKLSSTWYSPLDSETTYSGVWYYFVGVEANSGTGSDPLPSLSYNNTNIENKQYLEFTAREEGTSAVWHTYIKCVAY